MIHIQLVPHMNNDLVLVAGMQGAGSEAPSLGPAGGRNSPVFTFGAPLPRLAGRPAPGHAFEHCLTQ